MGSGIEQQVDDDGAEGEAEVARARADQVQAISNLVFGLERVIDDIRELESRLFAIGRAVRDVSVVQSGGGAVGSR